MRIVRENRNESSSTDGCGGGADFEAWKIDPDRTESEEWKKTW